MFKFTYNNYLNRCHSGWTGENCTVCEPMEGCAHGACDRHPNTCKCLPGWEGHLCNKPICRLKVQLGCHIHRYIIEGDTASAA